MTKRASLSIAVFTGLLAAGLTLAQVEMSPTTQPADAPATAPASPTSAPATQPTPQPTTGPSTGPTSGPTTGPTSRPGRRPTSRPTSRPARPPTSRPKAEIAPEAKPILEKVRAFYTSAKSLKADGTVTGSFDVAGRSKDYAISFTSLSDGSGRFSYQPKGIGLVMGNEQRITIFDAKRNAFAWLPPLKGRVPAANVPDGVLDILLDENPSILLMLTTQPDQILTAKAKKVRVAPADGEPVNPALLMESDADTRTVVIDGTTGAILSMTIDLKPGLVKAGAANIKEAKAVVKYDVTAPAGEIAKSVFEWTPPRGATEFTVRSEQPAPAPGPRVVPGPGGPGGPADPGAPGAPGGPGGPIQILPPTTQPASP